MKISNMKLGIGIPLTFPYVPSGFLDSMMVLERPDFVYIRKNNGPVDALRNHIVYDALNLGCSHLIMMDADMKYHPETITKLLAHRLPIVGALCYRRYPPFDPLMYRGKINGYRLIDEWEEGELVEVDATGTGCLLFSMEVFKKLSPPWFRFRPNPDPDRGGVVGEDFGFCSDLREAGYQIFVDTSVPSGHLSVVEITDNFYRLWKKLNPTFNKEEDAEDGS